MTVASRTPTATMPAHDSVGSVDATPVSGVTPWLTLTVARQLQDKHGWRDFLLPSYEAWNVLHVLATHMATEYLVTESPEPESIWVWMSPQAYEKCLAATPCPLGAHVVEVGNMGSWRSGDSTIPPSGAALRAIEQLNWDIRDSVERHFKSLRNEAEARV